MWGESAKVWFHVHGVLDGNCAEHVHPALFLPLTSALPSSDCFGVLDCEWCMVDSDGKTHLDKPYCALQKECFGGIVGAKSPYADGLGLLGGWNINLTQTLFKALNPFWSELLWPWRTFLHSPVFVFCEMFHSSPVFRSVLNYFFHARVLWSSLVW